MPEQEDKYEVRAMNEEQAKAWFALGDDVLSRMEIREIANLQLAVEKNPNAFTEAQRAQIKDLSWKKIEQVAKGKQKLNPKETNSFKSILEHAPSSMYMGGERDVEIFKTAEGKWYNADRGIEEKSFGERVKEQASQAKKHVSEKVAALGNKGKAVHRLNRMKYNRDKAAIKQIFATAKAKAAEFKNKVASNVKQDAKTAAEVPFVLAFGVKELASMAYNTGKNSVKQGFNIIKNGVNNVKNSVKRRVTNAKNKVSNAWNKTKRFGKNVWKGFKTAAYVTGYVVASPVILPYKAAKWVYNKGKAAINWVRNGYNNLKAKALAGPTEISKDVKTAEKQARGNQNKLSAEQIMANWKLIGKGESDGRYNMSRQSESMLDAVMKGELKIDKSNAPKLMAWLEVNRDIQDRINQNRAVAKNERNQAVAEQLEAFGYVNPYKTKETLEQEAQTQTPPVQDKTKEQEPPVQDKPKEQEPPVQDKPKEQEPPAQDKPKENIGLSPEQSSFVQTQLGILQQLRQDNNLKPEDDLYKGLISTMERGFAERGITSEQMEAIHQQHPSLFSIKEPNAQQPNAQQPNAQQPNAQQPNAQQPNAQQPNTQQPNAQQPNAQQPNAQQPNAQQPNAQQPNAQQPNAQQPNAQQPNAQQPVENTASTPIPNKPETFNYAALTGNEGVGEAETTKEQKPRTKEEALRDVLSQSGYHIKGRNETPKKEKPKPTRQVEPNQNTLATIATIARKKNGKQAG